MSGPENFTIRIDALYESNEAEQRQCTLTGFVVINVVISPTDGSPLYAEAK